MKCSVAVTWRSRIRIRGRWSQLCTEGICLSGHLEAWSGPGRCWSSMLSPGTFKSVITEWSLHGCSEEPWRSGIWCSGALSAEASPSTRYIIHHWTYLKKVFGIYIPGHDRILLLGHFYLWCNISWFVVLTFLICS